jgi:adenosylhomocysteine nucleosidase
MMSGNSGVINYGGSTTIRQSAVGDGATVILSAAPEEDRSTPRRADIGVITILGKEAGAVHEVLGLRRVQDSALPFFTGNVTTQGTSSRIVAIRALSQGQRSTVIAFEQLRRHYAPAVVVLTGIGGGIHPDITVGDVVVTTRVVYYDLRKETPHGRRRRGEEREAPAAIGHAVNSFFTAHGEPAKLPAGNASDYFHVLTGPIGSGDAVIADAESEIIRYLQAFNDKILAVDMEAGGLTQAFHEQDGPGIVRGWLVIRGISDDSSARKNDDHQDTAARHAALTLRHLLPYLRP